MTALQEYARLECPGFWQASPDAPRMNVTVMFGEASVVILDPSGTAVSHWSLAAVERINPGKEPALYCPSAEASEVLELHDTTMVEAIEKVRNAVVSARPKSGRLRSFVLTGCVAVIVGLLALWLPGALVRHTVSVVPEPTRAAVGTALFAQIGLVSGSPCRTPLGNAALARLHTRLVAPAKGGFLVLPGGVSGAVSLPGGLILLNKTLVEDHDTPDVVAGYVLAEVMRREEADPLQRLLEAAGLRATLRLLTTGELKETTLKAYAERLVTDPAAPVANGALLERFAAAKVAATPYAYGVDVTGESTLPLIEADPMRGGGAQPVLRDADWIALQQICGE
ncbi:hypothetical protein [Actibacterium sp. 188UL27-1]|uniref:hypothetical protein n=1 Tax=Actibacterium sp. 188UL27-1 TaxID=2786961 RepID=UPI001956516D|nr:hypothetical protein [Actibacterium sp. 188UL27-1]MBM7066642.1 hypothetical protein [Actibacterium sp. 188UL27-1]